MAKSSRKQRKRLWFDEQARQRHSSHKRALSRQASDRKAREMERARVELSRSEKRERDMETQRRTNMMDRGLFARLDAVGKSTGVNVQTCLEPGVKIEAYTKIGDMIFVRYDRRLTMSGAEDRTITDALISELAAETRALYYHELGHNLFTLPLYDLVALALHDGYDFRGVQGVTISDAHRVMASEEGESDSEHMTIDESFHRAWNILEDSRMELALCDYSPVMASYLTVLVIRQMIESGGMESLTSWFLLAGRTFLPDDLRETSRQAWDTMGAPLTGSTATSIDIEKVVADYAAATTPGQMIDCILTMEGYLGQMAVPGAPTNHGAMTRSGSLSGGRMMGRSLGMGDEKAKQGVESTGRAAGRASRPSDSGNGTPSGSSSSNKGAGDSASTSGDSGQDADGAPGGNGASPKSSAEDVLREALDSIRADQTNKDDVRAMNEAYNDESCPLSEFPYVSDSTDPNMISMAHSLAADMEQAFRAATQDTAPSWHHQQRRGVVEPMRYMTRQPGDMEFFRAYIDNGNPGHDLEVSVFLDVSGSMDGTGNELGAAAWAMKSACDALNIDCSVHLFDDRGYTLWTVRERVAAVPSIGARGGTDPSWAFSNVLAAERNKRQHLVLVMTDGEWGGGASSLHDYRYPNVYSVIFYYGNGWGRSNNPKGEMVPDAALATRLGSDEAYRIDDLMRMPQTLEHLLLSVV